MTSNHKNQINQGKGNQIMLVNAEVSWKQFTRIDKKEIQIDLPNKYKKMDWYCNIELCDPTTYSTYSSWKYRQYENIIKRIYTWNYIFLCQFSKKN